MKGCWKDPGSGSLAATERQCLCLLQDKGATEWFFLQPERWGVIRFGYLYAKHSLSIGEIALWFQRQQDTILCYKPLLCFSFQLEQMLAAKVVPDPTVMDSASVLFTLPGRVINSPSNQVQCFSLSAAPVLLMNDSPKLVAKTQHAAPCSAFVMQSHALAIFQHKIEFPRLAWIDDGVYNSRG